MSKHTPGPWKPNKTGTLVHAADNKLIAAVYGDHPECKPDERLEANAKLIAAAPELLEVAQSILADDLLPLLPAEYIAKVRAAIAKATE